MIGLDPKGFCQLDGATTGVGWWWGEVGRVVAGSDGAVANDGTPSPLGYYRLTIGFYRLRRHPLPEALSAAWNALVQGYPANPGVRSPIQYLNHPGLEAELTILQSSHRPSFFPLFTS